jgi:hypothetical protein
MFELLDTRMYEDIYVYKIKYKGALRQFYTLTKWSEKQLKDICEYGR